MKTKQLKGYYLHFTKTAYHKCMVLMLCIKFSIKLIWRGVVHDNSKFSNVEAKEFSKNILKLKTTTYGTSTYEKLLKEIEMKPAIDNHYKKNSHHPEHHQGIEQMDLHDLIEMYLDWTAAIKKHNDGNMKDSLGHNQKRFNIDNQIINIMKNSTNLKDWKGKNNV